MTAQQEQQALKQIYSDVSIATLNAIEVMEMFEAFLKTKNAEEVPTLPRGFGQ